MKKRLILVVLTLLLIVACTPEESPEFEFQYQEENFTEEEPGLEPEVTEDVTEETPKLEEPQEPEVPKEGTIEFNGEVQRTFPIIDLELDVTLVTKGELTFKVDDNNQVSGEGSGNVDATLKSDIGIAKCEGTKKIPITFSVTGKYNPQTTEMAFVSQDVQPANEVMTLDCPSEEAGDLSYQLPIPVLLFAGDGEEGEFRFLLSEPREVTKTITHPVPDWETNIPVTWTITPKLKPLEEFEFDVDVDPAIVEVSQGDTATPSITVKLVKGEPRENKVSLMVTEWPTLNAFITNTEVTPTETTTLTIETSCDTTPDTYLFSVRGETVGSFKTSTDTVSIVVTENPNCN